MHKNVPKRINPNEFPIVVFNLHFKEHVKLSLKCKTNAFASYKHTKCAYYAGSKGIEINTFWEKRTWMCHNSSFILWGGWICTVYTVHHICAYACCTSASINLLLITIIIQKILYIVIRKINKRYPEINTFLTFYVSFYQAKTRREQQKQIDDKEQRKKKCIFFDWCGFLFFIVFLFSLGIAWPHTNNDF